MAKTKKTDAATWKRRYEIASENQAPMFKTFAGWYDKMYAHLNTKDYAAWRSKIYLPIISNKAWSMIAKLTSLDPGFEVGLYGDALNNPETTSNAEKMQWLLEHDWSNPLFDQPMHSKMFSPLVDAVVTGTGIAKVPWTAVNDVRYEHAVDEYGELDFSTDEVIEKADGYNDLVPQDIMETYIAPGARTIQTAAWIILGDYATYDDLKAVNDSSGVEVYKNLDQVKTLKVTTDTNAQYKKSRERLTSENDNVSADSTLSQFRRYECYEKSTGYIYTYAAGQSASGSSDEWIELSCKPNPYWHGKYPLVAFYTRQRPHSAWGQGVFEDTERMLAAANDVVNHYMDNLNLSLDGMIMKPSGETYTYIVQPGGELIYDTEKPEQFKFPEPNPAQLNEIMQLLDSTIEEATISSYADGTPNSATDKTNGTAAGITALQNAAGDKIGAMKQSFSTAIKEIGYMWMKNRQQFMTAPMTLMGQVDNRPAPVTIDPKDLQSPMTLKINDASMEPESKQQRIGNFIAYIQQLQGLQQASFAQAQVSGGAAKPLFIDYTALVQDYTQLMGQANFDKIVLSPDELQQAQPQQEQDPTKDANGQPLSESISWKPADLLPSEQAQALIAKGIKPDPQRLAPPVDPMQQQAQAQAADDAAQLAADGHVHPSIAAMIGRP